LSAAGAAAKQQAHANSIAAHVQLPWTSDSSDISHISARGDSARDTPEADLFHGSAIFKGSREGYVFKNGDLGVGYYCDLVQERQRVMKAEQEARDAEEQHMRVRVLVCKTALRI